MEITRNRTPDFLELKVEGRLDAYWADHLTAALEEALREGADHLRLDMAGVVYMSSVGIRVLVRVYKEVQRLNGSFAVTNPSTAVRSVLELAGLESLLLSAAPAPAAAAPSEESRHVVRDGAMFEVFDLAPGARLEARLIGEPARLHARGFTAAHCRGLRAGESVLALGLGAFGRDFDECRGRFGEFLAAGGGAVYLPADGTGVPDYLVAAGAFVPELSVLYALSCEGTPALLARFEGERGTASAASPAAPVPLATLARAALDLAGAEAAAVAIIAECAGLSGAALRRSPAAELRFAFDLPGVRDWLWFTPERAFARSLALIVGVVARHEIAILAPFLRPLGAEPWPAGHFHAAAFSYRPLRRGRLDLRSTVATLFEREHLQGVLHLINDDRPIVGAGQSELVRGACWIGPLGRVTAEER